MNEVHLVNQFFLSHISLSLSLSQRIKLALLSCGLFLATWVMADFWEQGDITAEKPDRL